MIDWEDKFAENIRNAVELRCGPFKTPGDILWGVVKLPDGVRIVIDDRSVFGFIVLIAYSKDNYGLA